VITPASFHGEPDHFLDSGVALVEIKRHDGRVPVDAQRQLRQIVGADGETVEELAELVRKTGIPVTTTLTGLFTGK